MSIRWGASTSSTTTQHRTSESEYLMDRSAGLRTAAGPRFRTSRYATTHPPHGSTSSGGPVPNRSGARALRGAGASGSSAACPSCHLSATRRVSPISAAAQSLSCASTGESPSSLSHESGYSPPRFVSVNSLPPYRGLCVAQILPDGLWQTVLGHDALPLVVIRTENHAHPCVSTALA